MIKTQLRETDTYISSPASTRIPDLTTQERLIRRIKERQGGERGKESSHILHMPHLSFTLSLHLHRPLPLSVRGHKKPLLPLLFPLSPSSLYLGSYKIGYSPPAPATKTNTTTSIQTKGRDSKLTASKPLRRHYRRALSLLLTFLELNPSTTTMHLIKISAIVAATAPATTGNAGPIGYGICQAGCAGLATACYLAAGAVFVSLNSSFLIVLSQSDAKFSIRVPSPQARPRQPSSWDATLRLAPVARSALWYYFFLPRRLLDGYQ